MQTETLIEKIKALPSQGQAEVEDFVDFLTLKEDRKITVSAMRASERSFENVWDNDEDSVYDEL